SHEAQSLKKLSRLRAGRRSSPIVLGGPVQGRVGMEGNQFPTQGCFFFMPFEALPVDLPDDLRPAFERFLQAPVRRDEIPSSLLSDARYPGYVVAGITHQRQDIH